MSKIESSHGTETDRGNDGLPPVLGFIVCMPSERVVAIPVQIHESRIERVSRGLLHASAKIVQRWSEPMSVSRRTGIDIRTAIFVDPRRQSRFVHPSAEHRQLDRLPRCGGLNVSEQLLRRFRVEEIWCEDGTAVEGQQFIGTKEHG